MAPWRVLVIDDSPTIHKVIEHALQRTGMQLIHARDGKSGLSKAKELKPDLILLDFMMPGMNGYQVCKALSDIAELENIPIVLMSAKGETIGDKLVMTMGIVDYISKPFSPEALATVTQHAIEKFVEGGGEKTAEAEPLLKVGERSPEAAPTSADLSDPRGKAAIRGILSMIPAGDVFQLLKFQSQTGILHLARGQAHLEVFMREGGIAFARSHNVDEEFLLGRFLIETGALTAGDLEMFLQSRRGTSKLLGEQLVKTGHITREQLIEALKRQTEALMYEALRWGEGEFAFYVTEKLPAEAREADLHVPIEGIMLEGFRRVDEWGMIEKEIKDFDMVLSPARDSTGVIKRVELEPDEKRVLALVDGKRNVKDVIRNSRRSSFDACKILYRLLSARIIRKRSPREPSEEDGRKEG
ncbi:response regulator [Myxococcota bacterium]